jgi:HEPN domain-containing protein
VSKVLGGLNSERKSFNGESDMVRDKIFKREFATELFSIAENDLQAAKTLDADPAVRKETAMLMIQQAIEKSLKSLLCFREISIPQTHDLNLIIDRIQSAQIALPEFVAKTDFDELTPFATLRRYEEGHYEIQTDDMLAAIHLAASVLDWIREEISK